MLIINDLRTERAAVALVGDVGVSPHLSFINTKRAILVARFLYFLKKKYSYLLIILYKIFGIQKVSSNVTIYIIFRHKKAGKSFPASHFLISSQPKSSLTSLHKALRFTFTTWIISRINSFRSTIKIYSI